MEIIGASILVSVITTKILATYYFKKVDGYVKDMCEMTTKNNENTFLFYASKRADLHKYLGQFTPLGKNFF